MWMQIGQPFFKKVDLAKQGRLGFHALDHDLSVVLSAEVVLLDAKPDGVLLPNIRYRQALPELALLAIAVLSDKFFRRYP